MQSNIRDSSIISNFAWRKNNSFVGHNNSKFLSVHLKCTIFHTYLQKNTAIILQFVVKNKLKHSSYNKKIKKQTMIIRSLNLIGAIAQPCSSLMTPLIRDICHHDENKEIEVSQTLKKVYFTYINTWFY